MPNTKQNYRRMQGEKRGQEPIAERPDGCYALLVPDPFSEFSERTSAAFSRSEPRIPETNANYITKPCSISTGTLLESRRFYAGFG
jgi:hypothetical protein